MKTQNIIVGAVILLAIIMVIVYFHLVKCTIPIDPPIELNEPKEYKYTIGLTHTDNFQDTIIVYSKEEPLLFNNHHKNYYILRVGLITYAVDLKSISVIDKKTIK